MTGMIVGSIIGGYLPVLFGLSALSYTTILTSGLGGLIGIWLGYKLSNF